jgi:hypothetical protein
LEETGLSVVGTPALLFTTTHAVPGFGEWVAATYACAGSGALLPNDPDGYVLAAEWCAPEEALDRLALVSWYDTEPLRRWLSGEAPEGATYLARPG